MRGRVETGLECESHASPKDGGAEKSLSKQSALVHRDNGAAAQTASQPGGPAAPEGAVETGRYSLRLRWRPHSQPRPQRILPAHPSREILDFLFFLLSYPEPSSGRTLLAFLFGEPRCDRGSGCGVQAGLGMGPDRAAQTFKAGWDHGFMFNWCLP